MIEAWKRGDRAHDYLRQRAADLDAEADKLEMVNGTWANRAHMKDRWEKLKTITLKPCPFCGFVPEIEDEDCIYPATRDRTVWQINCYTTGGGCDADILGDSPEDVIEKWNRRCGDGLQQK